MGITVGIAMVRDEDDILAATLCQMLRQVDAVVVADNLSVDSSRDILEAALEAEPDRVHIVDDFDPAYTQSDKMTALAHHARSVFGEISWVVPFDADEWWYSPFGDRISTVLAGVPDRWHVVPATLFDHVATAKDPDVSDPVERMAYRRTTPLPLPKVAARYRPDLVIEQGNHGAHYDEFEPARFDPILTVRHFPYRSAEQFVRKVRNGSAAYRAAGDRQPSSAGAHWRQWGDILEGSGEDAVSGIFRKWFWRRHPDEVESVVGERQPALMYDPAPMGGES